MLLEQEDMVKAVSAPLNQLIPITGKSQRNIAFLWLLC